MRTSFHHRPEAQHPNSSAIHKLAGRLPHLWGQAGKRLLILRDRGIKEGGELGQADSIPHVEFLCLCGEFIKDLAPLRIDVLLVSEHVLKSDAPMRSHKTERKPFLF
jgi:hypothetical protein